MKRGPIFLLVLVMVISLCACGGGNESLAGTWTCESPSEEYPKSLILMENGEGIFNGGGMLDGLNCEWYIEGNELCLEVGFFGTVYEHYSYKLQRNCLYLDGHKYTKSR